MYFVYILYSPSADQFYKGQTNDIIDRVYRHNSEKEFATKSGTPWILLWKTTKQSRADAMVLEIKLKNLNRFRTIEFILKYNDGIPGRDEAMLAQSLSRC